MGTRAVQLIKCLSVHDLSGVASINIILKIVAANGCKLNTMARALYIIKLLYNSTVISNVYVNKWYM